MPVATSAGAGIGAGDQAHVEAGACIVTGAEEAFAGCDMIVKTTGPQALGLRMLCEGQILFTSSHLAPDREQARDLIAPSAVCVAYETETDAGGAVSLPKPMRPVVNSRSRARPDGVPLHNPKRHFRRPTGSEGYPITERMALLVVMPLDQDL